MSKTAYDLFEPVALTSSVIFASPHSGRSYPDYFKRASVLDEHTIRSSEDAFVDRLFEAIPRFGAPLIVANAPRAFIDLNRAADEMDPALIEGVRRGGHNPRVSSGLGVIPRVVANGRSIYAGKLTMAEARQRLIDHWHPYHARLQGLLDRAVDRFGQAILIDCHSMPREAVAGQLKARQPRPDVVIGDRFGISAVPGLVDSIDAIFQSEGFKTARNSPFAGAYITQHYGHPKRRQSAVQIEIDRSLYMDEARIAPNADFQAMQSRLSRVGAQIASLGRARSATLAAAE